MSLLRRHLHKMTAAATQRRIHRGKLLVTKLLWKESVAAFFYSVMARHQRLRKRLSDRLTLLAASSSAWTPWASLVEMCVALAMLGTMFYFPRSSRVLGTADLFDIAAVIILWMTIAVQFLATPVLCSVEATILAAATACIASGQREGTITYTVLLVRMPFAARALFPMHRETYFVCRAIEIMAFQLARLSPLLLSGVLVTIRSIQPDSGLLSDETHFALGLWRMFGTRSSLHLPIPQTAVCLSLGFFVFVAAAAVGVTEAFREYHEVADELMAHHRRRPVHRDIAVAPTLHKPQSLAELGKEIAEDWKIEIDVGKEAIEASHCDHTWFMTVRRFVKDVHYSLSKGVNPLRASRRGAGKRLTEDPGVRTWDCRNEAVVFRWGYDVQIIEKSLGRSQPGGIVSQTVQRQWDGSMHKREMAVVLLVMVILSCLYPNLYYMEAGFSAALTLELVYSTAVLGPVFVCCHNSGMGLALRLFSIVVGFVPQAIPYCCLRALRLLEGSARLVSVSTIHTWAIVHLMMQTVVLMLIGYIALMQDREERPNVPSGLLRHCDSEGTCASMYVTWLLLPAWYALRQDVWAFHPLSSIAITVFQLLAIPMVLSVVLHPLLQLHVFVTRFLRQVVSSLHNDFTSYLVRYVETVEWFSSRQITLDVKPTIAAKMRLWALGARARCVRQAYAKPLRRKDTKTMLLAQGIAFRHSVLAEPLFRSHADNEAYDGAVSWRQRPFIRAVAQILRSKYLHYIHSLLVVVSLCFVWATPAQYFAEDYSAGAPADLLRGVETSVHAASILASMFLFPADFTASLSLVGNLSLAIGVILIHADGAARDYRHLFVLRYLSHLRLFQLQRPFFFSILRETSSHLTRGLFRSLLVVILAGGVTCIVFTMQAQLHFVLQPAALWANNATNKTTMTNITHGAHVPYSEAYPDGSLVRDYLRKLFLDHGPLLYVFFNAWLVVSIVVGTCLVLMRISCDNLMNRRAQFLRLVPFLEDPITTGSAPLLSTQSRVIRYVGHALLGANLGFMAFAHPSFMPHFFLVEISFAAALVADSFLRARYSLFRSSRSAVNTSPASSFDSLLLGCDLLQLLYWLVSTATAAALTIYGWQGGRDIYLKFWTPWRYLFAFRLLPRLHHLVLSRSMPYVCLAALTVGVYFCSAAGVLANTAMINTGFSRPFRTLFSVSLEQLVRLTFVTALPTVASETYRASTEGPTTALMFALSVVGKVVLAGAGGVLISAIFSTSASSDMMSLPPKAQRLYDALCSGADGLSHCLLDHHSTRVDEQVALYKRKYDRIFAGAIPTWGVPHVLEASGVIAPACQRRLMFLLRELLAYLPIKERRDERVAQYAFSWGEYSSGGPGDLSFVALPVYPAAPNAWWTSKTKARPVVIDVWELPTRYVDPLRLVQAVAMIESWFPSTTSIESKMWQEFAVSHQKVRAAVMLQSLWRMYQTIVEFENDMEQDRQTRAMCQTLRRSFRRSRLLSQIAFCMAGSLEEAMAPFRRCFNPPLVHVDLLERLRGRYGELGGRSTGVWSAGTGRPHSLGVPDPGSTSETRVRVDPSALLQTRANLRYDQALDDPTVGRNPGTPTELDSEEDDLAGTGDRDSTDSGDDDNSSTNTQEGGNVLEVRAAMASVSRRPLPSPPNSRQPWSVVHGSQ
jgi:hypothetical protein